MPRTPSSPPRLVSPSGSRALLASGAVHVAVLGAGVLLGILAPGGLRGEPHAYEARFAPVQLAELELDPRERLDLVEPPDPSEPELCESEVWSLSSEEPVPDLAPETPEPSRALDWVDERPFAIGSLAVAAPPTAAPAAPTRALAPEPAVYVVAPPAAPVVAAPVPRSVPPPAYPRLSRRTGEEGSVLCRLSLDATGRVCAVEVVESSGHERLDQAARETLATWSFEPRREDGRAVAATLLHRVTFRLGSG